MRRTLLGIAEISPPVDLDGNCPKVTGAKTPTNDTARGGDSMSPPAVISRKKRARHLFGARIAR